MYLCDSLEESLVRCLPRLIQDELCRGLSQYTSTVSKQVAGRLDVRAQTPVNKLPLMSRTSHIVSTPVTAHQLLHSGQVNSAFEMVSACFVHTHCHNGRVLTSLENLEISGNIKKSGKLREFEMYSVNFWSPLLSATKM